MVDTRLLVHQLFLLHLLLSEVVLAFFGEVLHVIVHPHVFSLLNLLVVGSSFGVLDVLHMVLNLLLLAHELALSVLLAHLLSSQGDFKISLLVVDLVNISLLLESNIVSVEPGSISTSLLNKLTERLITLDNSQCLVLEVRLELLIEDLFLTLITVGQSITELLLIPVEVVLVVLVVSRLAGVLRQECSTADLINSTNHGLSTNMASAQVIGVVSISSVTCS